MLNIRSVLVSMLAAFIFISAPGPGHAKTRDRVKRDFRHADTNKDNQLSRKEWMRRGNFDMLDQNGDGFLSLKEVRAIYKGHDDKDYDWPPTNTVLKSPRIGNIDPGALTDKVSRDTLDKETLCGIGRSSHCSIEPQRKRGLIETGTGPRFPEGTKCSGMDDYWAMNYSSKRNRDSYHGGIDLPVPWGKPMLAVASGSVVALYKAHLSKRGNEVVIRHSPEQTGLPIWTYSAYGHLDKLPNFEIGQRINKGDIIGPTGNSGISAKGKKGSAQSTTRRPAIHLAMFYSKNRTYAEANNTIIPVDGRWLDPFAFYRQKEPFMSDAVKALPDAEKDVDIPIMFDDGTTIPADTKIIWPYTCTKTN
ncbi:MAG: peptidoglycan DD-metalloendopeptidase family protein [Magnetovibrio sp.]|nr:peptidoglycan DD-metalloendopeptidase family protein [Magnetovibrio sp.]